MATKQKLELTWIGKENRPRLEPRILLEDPEKSYHAQYRVKEWPQENAKNTKDSDSLRSLRSFAAKNPSEGGDLFENRLIFGDNLLALKALEQEFTGKIKCIYIDPPYNTGSAFTHYDDGVEHSLGLSLIRERIEILWRLLTSDGSLWVSIDDYEMPYLRVLMDEVCGRASFVATNIWQKRYSRENREAIGDVHEYLLVYVKQVEQFNVARNRVPITEEQAKIYKNPTMIQEGDGVAFP